MDPEAPDTLVITPSIDNRYVYWGDDGVTYYMALWVDNTFGTHSSMCRKEFTLDASPPVIEVTGLEAEHLGDGIISLEVDAVEAGDGWLELDHWLVCWSSQSFTMEEWQIIARNKDLRSCAKSPNSELTFNVTTGLRNDLYYFGVAPVDVLGNEASGRSLASLDLRDFSTDRQAESSLESQGADDEGGIPGWAIGVIIAMFAVSFLVGGFILTRGGGGSGGDSGDDWDY